LNPQDYDEIGNHFYQQEVNLSAGENNKPRRFWAAIMMYPESIILFMELLDKAEMWIKGQPAQSY